MEKLTYSKKVMAHFLKPKNQGKIKNPTVVGQAGNPICGDVMKLYLKIKSVRRKGKTEEIIQDIKFETLGCVAAIATSSMLTSLAKGKTLEEAEKITKQHIAHALDGLPAVKMHCSVLAARALQDALVKYKKLK